SPQADRFAGAKREEKASACSVRNDGLGAGSARGSNYKVLRNSTSCQRCSSVRWVAYSWPLLLLPTAVVSKLNEPEAKSKPTLTGSNSRLPTLKMGRRWLAGSNN